MHLEACRCGPDGPEAAGGGVKLPAGCCRQYTAGADRVHHAEWSAFQVVTLAALCCAVLLVLL